MLPGRWAVCAGKVRTNWKSSTESNCILIKCLALIQILDQLISLYFYHWFRLGCVTLTCLTLAMVLPDWLTTQEAVPPAPSSQSQSERWILDIHIGLFSLCPHISNMFPESDLNRTSWTKFKYQYPSLSCASIQYNTLFTKIEQPELLLWAPVRRTQEVVDSIR